jgi:RND family efflux transporter MFP subunit
MLALLLAVGCGRGDRDRAGQRPTVSVVAAQTRSLPDRREHVGTLRAVNQVDVRARVRGFLTERTFTEGQVVHQGDVLFRIDPSTYEVRLKEARGALARAQAVRTRARRDLERAQGLYEQQVASEAVLDERRAAADAAQAEVATAEAAVAAAELDLSYCVVSAPLTGRIGRAQVDVGNLVGEGGQDTVLANIVQIDPIHVVFNPTEQERLRVLREAREGRVWPERVGHLQVELELGDGSRYPHRGVLDFVDPTIDPTRGTITVRAIVPNPDGTLKPGEYVRVIEFWPDIPDAVVVPERAIQDEQGGSYVFVVGPGDVVEHRPVTVGAAHEGLIQVAEGLAAGERVIVDGVQKARPGEPVQVRAEGDGEAPAGRAERPAASGAKLAEDPPSPAPAAHPAAGGAP